MKQDLELAFDVGHSSIGWAVLQNQPQLEIKGCGAVIFRPDDCLASKRRGYRRQRRNIRATKQRIRRMKALLLHLGVLTQTQLDKPGCAWPWKLAARVLCGGKPLTWSELWDVLRWYAHNRGYHVIGQTSDIETDEDTEKVQNAHALMHEYKKETMAETVCAVCGIDPMGAKCASNPEPAKRFKAKNAAFPRGIVEAEVARILKAHFGKLKGADEKFATALFSDWKVIPCAGVKLPLRYQGGLLFGRLGIRFYNRIISTCPVTYAQEYQTLRVEGMSHDKASERARVVAKVPSRNTPEFLNYRWGMLLANVQVARLGHTDLRPLKPEERKELDKRMRAVGSMTEKQFKEAVRDVSGAIRGNFDTMFMEVNQKEALILDPVQDYLTSGHTASLFPTLSERIQKRARGQLRRGKSLTLGELGNGTPAFDAAVQQILDKGAGKGRKKDKALTRESLLGERLQVKRLSGRAAYARPILRKAFEEVMAGNDPRMKGGCLFVTEQMRQAQSNRTTAQQTNNHLVRHRLLVLERLLRDIVKEYAAGDRARIEKVTVEVNRDLQEFSGLDVQAKAKLQGLKLSNHKKVSEKLEATLKANNRLDAMSASLIRKARVADDLGCVCPYVGPKKPFELIDLVNKRVDLDHIVPKTERQSDSLDSLVVTYSEINAWKSKRTAWQFVKDEQGKQVPGRPDLSIQSLAHYEDFVNSLPPHRDPFKRQMENGERRFLDDDKRRWRRKKLLLLPEYTEKTFTQRDLTQTSQITRLAQQTILKSLDHLAPHNVIPIPGSLTGLVRKAWNALGCLSLACPQTEGRNKTEVRGITHLHHALDACVLSLAAHHIPNNGRVWELITKRNLNPSERAELTALGVFAADAQGRAQLKDLSPERKDQIRQRLAERRVVQHIPRRMSGMPVDLNMWRLHGWGEDGKAILEKHSRDQATGKRKEDKPKAGADNKLRLVGWDPEGGDGKLKKLKAVLITNENFGVALDPEPTIIPFLKVGVQLYKGLNGQKSLVERNGGKMPRILRPGQLISVPEGTHKGDWRVFSIKNNANGVALSLGGRDALGCDKSKQNVLVRQLLRDEMTILNAPLTGVACSPAAAKLA